MRLTQRVLLAAIVVTLVAAVTWPTGAERVGRGAVLAVGAALVADLLRSVWRAFPIGGNPFAPARRVGGPPWRPHGLAELQRDLRLMSVAARDRPSSLSTRLRVTCQFAAQRQLRSRGLDLDRAEDRDAARALLGDGPYDFIVGDAPAASVDELLAALEPGSTEAGDREGRA